LEVFGLSRLAPEGEALASLLAVRVPDGVDEAALRRALLLEHGIEISGGLGPLAGAVWRVGVMGEGARVEPQRRLLSAIGDVLGLDGGRVSEALAALDTGWAL
jgi:alanine-glyoxylate transaminase/serine-glyoxylate transaminase/serine-pyruvate transaminase